MPEDQAPPPRKGTRWLADRITSGADPAAGEKIAVGRRLSRAEIDELVERTVEEELERLEDEEL